MGIVLGVLILSFLVFVHELGHFLVAKRAGVRVETFSMGFGPKLLRFRYGETEYCISALPFGGYVKMTGQEDLGVPDATAGDPRDFRSQPIRTRIAIVAAGPAFNYLLALFVLTLMYASGVREAISPAPVVGYVADSSRGQAAGFCAGDTLLTLQGKPVASWESAIMEIALRSETPVPVTVRGAGGARALTLVPKKTGREGIGVSGLYPAEPVILGGVVAGGPAEKAGLRTGDTVVAADGVPVPAWDALVDRIMSDSLRPLALTVRNAQGLRTVTVTPEYNTREKRSMIGVSRGATYVKKRYPLPTAFSKALRHTGDDALMIVKFLKALVSARVSVKSMAGPVGIVHLSGEVARSGFDVFLLFLAMISVNLAVVNLFPFLIITDGGVIFFLLIERFRGRPLTPRHQAAIQQAAIFAILALFLLITYNDIFRLVRGQ
ncbi:MAG: RIP metalloprotease RseP [Fibrobacterota bacterium]